MADWSDLQLHGVSSIRLAGLAAPETPRQSLPERHCPSRGFASTKLSSRPRIQLGLNSPAAAWAPANIFFAEIDQTTTTTVATIRHVAFAVRFLQIVRHDRSWINQFGERQGRADTVFTQITFTYH